MRNRAGPSIAARPVVPAPAISVGYPSEPTGGAITPPLRGVNDANSVSSTNILVSSVNITVSAV